jgi:cell wall-associated NlpC family hydrolase
MLFLLEPFEKRGSHLPKLAISKQMAMLALALAMAGCASTPSSPSYTTKTAQKISYQERDQAKEVVMYAMGLMDVDYHFGGSNPESGLDCSGMVSYIFRQALGMKLPHNAAQIAQLGQDVPLNDLQPGDLVFFNTQHRPYSHVGIYIGDDRFVHAPSSASGKIMISSLKSSYYAKHFEAARTFFY